MRHTTRSVFSNKRDDDARFGIGIQAPRCKYCNSLVSELTFIIDVCANCRIKCKLEQEARASANRKRSQSGLIGTLKQRISSALARSLKENFRGREKPNLTMTFLLRLYDSQKGKCALSGRDLSLGSIELNKYDANVLSIDRIDSSKGYVEDNVQFVTYQINVAKGRHSNEEFIAMCQDVVNKNSSNS